MSPASLAFFTIDHGTASTAVSLIAPVENRFRLLASSVGPSSADMETMLEDLVRRVEAVEPGLLGPIDAWRDWARVSSATRVPPRVLCLAASETAVTDLEEVFLRSGWTVAGTITARHLDVLDAFHACLDPDLDAIAIGSPGAASARDPDRALRSRLGPLVAAAMGQRGPLTMLLCGTAADWTGLEDRAMVHLPAPDAGLAEVLAERGTPPARRATLSDLPDGDVPDGRWSVRHAVATLATLLDRRIEAVDIGHAAGTRTLAEPSGALSHVVAADAALVPEEGPDTPALVERIVRWSAIRADPFTLADRLRNLRVSPWRDLAGDGPRLRLAALRAALGRLDRRWREGSTAPAPGAEMLLCSGGAFSVLPPPAAAIAVVDGMRRPGAFTLFHDHARILGPIGALQDEGDRRRLLVDLLDDALLPLGSAIVTGEVREGSRGAALRVTSRLQQHELELAPSALRLIDLPPGVPARVDVEMHDGQALGVRARRIALDVAGGLGGVLVDTREVPLRLPERVERRRALLEAWERPIWGGDA